jgi:hypothetical protein
MHRNHREIIYIYIYRNIICHFTYNYTKSSLQASGSTVESIVRLKKELKQFKKLMNVRYRVIPINGLIS